MKIAFTSGFEGTKPKAGFAELVSGFHHSKLVSLKQGKVKYGAPTMIGEPSVIWCFKVLDGPSKGANFEYETALSGYFMSSYKEGQRVDGADFCKRVIVALDPTIKIVPGEDVDLEALIGKEAEVLV